MYRKIFIPLLLMIAGIFLGFLIVRPSPVWNEISKLQNQTMGSESRLQTILVVGNVRVSNSQVDFEVKLSKLGVFDDFHSQDQQYNEGADATLREFAIEQIIERKLFIQMIAKDVQFDATAPNLYTTCTEQTSHLIQQTDFLRSNSYFQDLAREIICEMSLIESYFNSRILKGVRVPSAELEAAFRKFQNASRGKPKVSFRQIVFATEAEAREVKKSLTRENFADTARKKSISGEAEAGGLILDLTRNQMPALFEVAFSMETGQISDIVKTPYGYHILNLIGKGQNFNSSAEARARLADELLAAKKEEERKKWLSSALRTFDVRWGGVSGPSL